MDFPIGKGSAPRRLFVDQTQPFPSCPKITPKDDINPLSDFRFDQTITLLSETAPDSPANNCAQPLSSWPAQVTITPLPPYNVNPQPPTNPAKILLPTPITPNVVSITPKETFDANPSALFGSQPLTIDCRAFSPSPVATRADPAPNSQGNIIQPLCYGPVSEGHYFLLQPVCCEFIGILRYLQSHFSLIYNTVLMISDYLNKDGNTVG